MLTRNLISFSFELDGFLSLVCLEMSYRNFPSATILQTGGLAVGAISTRSRPMPWALRKASDNFMTPSCSPLEPKMTRTSRARIRPFTRNCCCRLNQSPGRRRRECAATSYFSSSQSPAPAWGIGRNTLRRRSCDDCDNGPAIFREPKGSCRQDFGAGKVNLRELNFSSARWRAEMGGMCFVSLGVIQHRIERSQKRRYSGKSRKDRSISNFRVEHERRPLRHLQQTEISSVGTDTCFNHSRTRPFE